MLIAATLVGGFVYHTFGGLFLKAVTCFGFVAVGSALFYFSHLMLALNVFACASYITDTLCLATYYPAQWLLAYSICRFVKQK